jgi:molecular chaperone HtpG
MSSKETMKFDAEIGKVLQLMIHSLYTNRDIFLRELISNASDACDKLRYLSLTKPELMNEDNDFKITIMLDDANKTLTIADNGIGMNKQDLIDNLGTIARSGTQRFLEQMTGDQKNDTQLIGQFGVGFYSSFMVADEVTVVTRKAGEKKGWTWISKGDGEFTIEPCKEQPKRGTSITMKLKEEAHEFCDKFRLKHIIKTYSDHISIPIELVDEEGKGGSKINSASALWARPKSDISDEQYTEFYRGIAHAGDDPWMVLHNKNEGVIEYSNLLFIPTRKPFDLFHPDRKARVKLYVKRVYITEDAVNIVPSFMRFLRGVVDSEDLPLNISRETLQNNLVIEKIRKSIVKRVLAELKKKKDNDFDSYLEFWKIFGPVLKEGLCEGIEFADSLLEVSLFYSALHNKYISLDDYIASLQAGQEALYYLAGDDLEKLKCSPQLEGFLKRGVDVLLFTDHVDDFWVNINHEYKEKALMSVTRSGIDLDNVGVAESETKAEEESSDGTHADIENLLQFTKTTLGPIVKDVKISGKLTSSPACLTVAEGSMDIRMERFLIDQKQLPTAAQKIFEVNSKHPIIKKMASDLNNSANEPFISDMVKTLYDQACIIEGEPLANAADFSKRLSQLLETSLTA